MKFLITGGLGFLGSNLSAEVLRRGEELIVFENFSRKGSAENKKWLEKQGLFTFTYGDIRSRNDIDRVIIREKPNVIFHLAGQVAMTASIDNPRLDFEVNALGTMNLLESVRKHSPDTIIVYSSTNKVYGDLEWVSYGETPTRYVATDFPQGFPEDIPMVFHSPYGCSKGSADQYMLDYQRMYDIGTVVFRHSSMFGGRQFATYDQGWVGWFCQKAIEKKRGLSREPFKISGNGKQVRDLLYASDMVNLYFKTVENIESARGEAFNIGGGAENALSLLELFAYLEKKLDITMGYRQLPPRASDQKVFIADISKARKIIGWEPSIPKEEGLSKMLAWAESMVG